MMGLSDDLIKYRISHIGRLGLEKKYTHHLTAQEKESDVIWEPAIPTWYTRLFSTSLNCLRKNQMFRRLAHAAKHADVSHVPHVACQVMNGLMMFDVSDADEY